MFTTAHNPRHTREHARILTDDQVYEQSRFANEIGAAVHLAPNANGILRRWGIYAEEFGANPMDRLIERLSTGNVRMNLDLSRANTQWQHPWLLVHRANLHDHLKKIATAQEGEGKPVGLHTSSKVVELDPAAGSLTLGDSTVVLADILVGADGIYVCHKLSVHCSDGLEGVLILCLVYDKKVHPGRAPL